MILLSALIGSPIELFGTEPNQDLIFRAYSTPFANLDSWVRGAFTDFFNNCWGPNWWNDGRQIQSIEAIVQSQSPDSAVSDSNNTEGAYAWDIRFKTTATGDGTRHQRFYYRPTENWTYSSSTPSGCQSRKNMLMGYDNSGPEAIGVPTGTFTSFDQGHVPTATWELISSSYCIGNVTVTQRQCGKWYLGDGCHDAPLYTRETGYGGNPCVTDANGDLVEVWKKKTGSGTQGNVGFRIYQKVGEDLPYKLIRYNCSDESIEHTNQYINRSSADQIGSAWVTSQYEDIGATGSDEWPNLISRPCCESDNSCDDSDDDTNGNGNGEPVPCADPNAEVLSDGSCGSCNTGYEVDENGVCTASEDNDDIDDDEETPTLKYILIGGGALLGLLVLKKLAS